MPLSGTPTDPRRELRERLRAQRAALAPSQRIAAAQGVARQLQALPEMLLDERIGVYWAVQAELSLHLVVAQCWRRGQQVHLPVVRPGGRLAYAAYSSTTPVQPNRYSIPEPVAVLPESGIEPNSLQLVFVPLLGFDRRGHRLGYGGGYYDRSFAFLRSQPRPALPLLVGVAYASQQVDALPTQDWDVPLDFVATESELIDCSGTN